MRPTDVILRWPTPGARRWTSKLISRVQTDPHILAVVALGSAVRDVGTSADLDLLIVHSGTPLKIRAPIEIDLRQYAEDEVVSLLLKGHDLLGWAARLGQVVFERDGYWTRLSEEYADCLPLPDPASARERVARAKTLLEQLVAVGDEDGAAEQEITMLTHEARALLLESSVFPASRPELSAQLEMIGTDPARTVARALRSALDKRAQLLTSVNDEESR